MSKKKATKCTGAGCKNMTWEVGLCVICRIGARMHAQDSPAIPTETQKIPEAPVKSKEQAAPEKPIPPQKPYKPVNVTTPAHEQGPIFEQFKFEGLEITPEQAERYLMLNTYTAQRPIKEKNLSELVDTIDEGKWRCAEISFAVMPGGREILVNGQHTLQACIKSGDDIFVFIVSYPKSAVKVRRLS